MIFSIRCAPRSINEEYYVLYLNEAGFPLSARVGDVQPALKRVWGVFLAEWHAIVLKMTIKEGKGRFGATFFQSVNMPLTVERTGYCESTGIFKSLDTTFHMEERLLVFDRPLVELLLVDSKAYLSVLFEALISKALTNLTGMLG